LIDELPVLITSENENEISLLIEYLDQLRFLMEQYSYADMVTIFGEGWS